ncbi:MAG: hypothetical protein RL277_1827 [Planctomycetota bacterium]
MLHRLLILCLLATTNSACLCATAQDKPAATLRAQTLPVREVTVFKDGHAYLLREGRIPANAAGELVLDELPIPVMGTFWPYAADGAKLVYAKAGHEESENEVDALDLRQLIEANQGRKASLKDASNDMITGTLRGVPKSADGNASASFVLIESTEGTRAIDLMQVRWIQIEGQAERRIKRTIQQARLRLRTEPTHVGGAGGGADAKVGVAYVQRGLRWVPAYKLDIDGDGKARVQMEASLVNDLIDLESVTMNLVIGVPSFEFSGLNDPISMQQELAAVSARMDAQQAFYNVASNALRTQVAGFAGDAGPSSATPEVAGGEAAEDLFVFTLRNITLKKGERMTLPLREFTLGYADLYKLDLPFTLPMEVRERLNSQQILELARQLSKPTVIHTLRLKNDSDAPLTTAPALVLSKGRVLAQGKLLYTPVGAQTDLAINPAIDVRVTTDERELGRTPNSVSWNNESYGRIDLGGEIRLLNQKNLPIEIEVTRQVLGLVDSVEQGGTMRQLEIASIARELERTPWWGWWSWPYWWFRFNGFGEYRWTVKLEPGKETVLQSKWHYFWR